MLAVRVLQRGDATQPRVAEAVEEVGALVEPGQAGELLVLSFGEGRGQRQGQVSRLRLGRIALPVGRTHALRGAGSATGALGLLTGGHGGSHPAQGSLLDDGGTEEAGREMGKTKSAYLIYFSPQDFISVKGQTVETRRLVTTFPISQC